MSSTLTSGPRSTGICSDPKVTVISLSSSVTGSPLKAGKIADTTAGGQIEVSNFPSK